jgi:hypothetical protein
MYEARGWVLAQLLEPWNRASRRALVSSAPEELSGVAALVFVQLNVSSTLVACDRAHRDQLPEVGRGCGGRAISWHGARNGCQPATGSPRQVTRPSAGQFLDPVNGRCGSPRAAKKHSAPRAECFSPGSQGYQGGALFLRVLSVPEQTCRHKTREGQAWFPQAECAGDYCGLAATRATCGGRSSAAKCRRRLRGTGLAPPGDAAPACRSSLTLS